VTQVFYSVEKILMLLSCAKNSHLKGLNMIANVTRNG